MLRICNVVCDITSGGVESVLINYFSNMDLSCCELDLVTYGIASEACAEKFRQLGFNIIIVPPKRSGFFRSIREMNRVISKGNYDVVHSHLTEWNCIPMFLAWKNGVKKRISHSHMAEFPHGLKRKILLSLQRNVNCIFSNKYCACGEDAAKYLYGEKLFQEGKVQVLNNAIEVQRFKQSDIVRREVRKELEIQETTFCVGHIGRFLEQKNHTFLIDIFTELQKIQPDSCLILLGIGDLEEEIRKKVEQAEISKKVHFLGVRSDTERIYQAMDIFCLPSLYEGLPVVGIEVQAAGIPCLMSDTVSRKVKLTPLVHMLGLDSSPLEWAKKLSDIGDLRGEYRFPDEYDISVACKYWMNLYKG